MELLNTRTTKQIINIDRTILDLLIQDFNKHEANSINYTSYVNQLISDEYNTASDEYDNLLLEVNCDFLTFNIQLNSIKDIEQVKKFSRDVELNNDYNYNNEYFFIMNICDMYSTKSVIINSQLDLIYFFNEFENNIKYILKNA